MTLDRRAFIRANTKLLAPPLVPEILLHLAEESLSIWQKTEEEIGALGLPPPFWAFAWAGGQALARYVLDNAEIVAGRRVLDLASGCGIDAIAAMKAGAKGALAADVDPFAAVAARLNAEANGMSIETTEADLLPATPRGFEVLLVGDLFYERPLAERALAFARAARAEGAEVFVGDPGRSYFPRAAFEEIAQYSVPVTRELEDSEIKLTRVWRLA
ncbi:MAG: methyltransferase [Hyphomicrobiaceae bacterium]|nr:MAG: methyltransferase [Hyphomicrobiaceae bacterium]